ncbi:TRAP transporter large permease subunit [candidate division KSB3 bacterium]|uniref:TRAP transporter large permease subunit n=1 Tax=candidate division KSB3 bacterium TaxID=2044937 RepID=A0A9D5Q668_9BACT|nr:TRAP transporter large permease subunit [candidate division KSB3 bacterium]MBD3324601.1 TRAP transporter large permease subunit [candidate division KSB3 bacterium]
MTISIAVFFILLILGMPIGFVLGVTAVVAIYVLGMPDLMSLVATRFYSGADLFPLMAMPLFILAGEIMNRTGITLRVIDFANVLVGHIRGGLGHANILASVFFAGLTGSAVADTAAIGTMLIPTMRKTGYSASFAAAITASSSCIGPIIPPSTIMVIYGSFMGVSIAGLFAGGLIPGLLMAPALMLLTYRYAKRTGLETTQRRATLKEVALTFKSSALALAMPVIILGGILTGWFTPTEAGAVAVLYGLVVGFVVYRNIKFRDLWGILSNMSFVTAIVFIILGTAAILSWLLAAEQVPQKVAAAVLSVTENRYLVLFFINILLLLVGCFMDQTAALIILGPVLTPLALGVGVHPLHFGIIMCLNLVIGLTTPPLGACLFSCCSIARISVEQITKDIWPQILALLIVLMIVTYFPPITLTLPRLLGFID